MGLGPHDPWCSGHGDERPRWNESVVPRQRRCWACPGSSCSQCRTMTARSSRRSRPPLIWSAARTVVRSRNYMTAAHAGCRTCPPAGGRRWCGSSGSGGARRRCARAGRDRDRAMDHLAGVVRPSSASRFGRLRQLGQSWRIRRIGISVAGERRASRRPASGSSRCRSVRALSRDADCLGEARVGSRSLRTA
jgi:hypothetical protein